MSVVLIGVSAKSEKITAKSFQRIYFSFQGGATASEYNLNLIMVKGILTRGGKTYEIIPNEKLKPLVYESMFEESFDLATQESYFSGTSTQQMPLYIDLESPLTCHGDDIFEITVTPLTGWYGGNSSANSQITVECKECDDIEVITPFIKLKVVDAAVSSVNESLGNNVTRVSVITTDATAITEANHIFDNIQISSTQKTANYSFLEMLNKRYMQFPSATLAQARKRCFQFPNKVSLDNCNFTAGTIASNISASTTFIVWRGFYVHPETVLRSADLKARFIATHKGNHQGNVSHDNFMSNSMAHASSSVGAHPSAPTHHKGFGDYFRHR